MAVQLKTKHGRQLQDKLATEGNGNGAGADCPTSTMQYLHFINLENRGAINITVGRLWVVAK